MTEKMGYSLAEAAKAIGISETKMRELCLRGVVKSIKLQGRGALCRVGRWRSCSRPRRPSQTPSTRRRCTRSRNLHHLRGPR